MPLESLEGPRRARNCGPKLLERSPPCFSQRPQRDRLELSASLSALVRLSHSHLGHSMGFGASVSSAGAWNSTGQGGGAWRIQESKAFRSLLRRHELNQVTV